ncbi:hypothetical protein SAMN04488063_0014 [Halopelagius inordinatus]|uniref:Uncharacterized protein n=1 Tax=Halopelagius inordinatus TaxID=553467 RepID=A0A1I2WV22_9EURY|nr:hypothetical protein [Halopelagius inordinatus]SFH05194.1 hypothetical protein SAMN04488063_0014 [Halopelagius inordinatus]
MTRRTRRAIQDAVADLEATDPEKLGGRDIYRWVNALDEEGMDAGRPSEFFGPDREWTSEVRELYDTIVERYPSFTHISPAEAFALSYMPKEVTDTVLELLIRDPPDAFAEKYPGPLGPDLDD